MTFHFKSGLGLAKSKTNTALLPDECQGDLADGHGIRARHLLVSTLTRLQGMLYLLYVQQRTSILFFLGILSTALVSLVLSDVLRQKMESELPSGLLLERG